MARSKRRRVDADQAGKKFEAQMRELNRKRVRHVIGGLLVIAAIALALQFTPYRNVHRDVIRAAKGLLESLTAGSDAPVEPNPTYW